MKKCVIWALIERGVSFIKLTSLVFEKELQTDEWMNKEKDNTNLRQIIKVLSFVSTLWSLDIYK